MSARSASSGLSNFVQGSVSGRSLIFLLCCACGASSDHHPPSPASIFPHWLGHDPTLEPTCEGFSRAASLPFHALIRANKSQTTPTPCLPIIYSTLYTREAINFVVAMRH